MTTEEFAEYVKTLLKTEEELNRFTYLDIPIGGLFSNFLFKIGQNRRKPTSRYQSTIHFKLLGRALINYRKYKFRLNGDLLFIKASERESHNRLMNPLIDAFDNRATVFSSERQNAQTAYMLNSLPALNLKDLIKGFTFVSKKFIGFQRIFKKNNIEAHPALLFFTFLRQILLLQTSYNILKKGNTKLIVCAYDRNPNTNFFILAANNLGVKTVTLVHGAIYPPYGFAPVLADEIWCWEISAETANFNGRKPR